MTEFIIFTTFRCSFTFDLQNYYAMVEKTVITLNIQWNLVIKRSDITKPSYNKVILLVPSLYISLLFYPDIMRNPIKVIFMVPRTFLKRFHCIYLTTQVLLISIDRNVSSNILSIFLPNRTQHPCIHVLLPHYVSERIGDP